MVQGKFISSFHSCVPIFKERVVLNQPLLRLSHRARHGHLFLGSRRQKKNNEICCCAMVMKRGFNHKKKMKLKRTNFLFVEWINLDCPYRRDSSILSRKTVRTGFAVFRLQKPENIYWKSCQLKGFLINAQNFRSSLRCHEFLVSTERVWNQTHWSRHS